MTMDIKFNYETYQDVRRNLFLYSIPVLIVAGFFAYFCILPSSYQQQLTSLGQLLTESPIWKGVLGGISGILLFTLVAFLMTEIFQVHDQWYDKFIIRWRFRYATDFILPRLVQPFASFMNYRFYDEAEKSVRQFQEVLYYPFVGDRDLKIPKNALVRFYEVVTVYWLTQINEIVISVLAIGTMVFRFFGPADLQYRTVLLNDLIVMGVAWVVNRIWVQSSRGKVRRATEDEIRAIHEDEDLRADLERRLKQLCRNYSVPYETGANASPDE